MCSAGARSILGVSCCGLNWPAASRKQHNRHGSSFSNLKIFKNFGNAKFVAHLKQEQFRIN